MKTASSSKAGFTLVEIMIVVAIIGLLAAIAIPNFIRSRNRTQTNSCINNLRQIDGAKHLWALENKKGDSDEPTEDDIGNYLRSGQFPHCPISIGVYTINPISTDPVCSLSTLADPYKHILPTP